MALNLRSTQSSSSYLKVCLGVTFDTGFEQKNCETASRSTYWVTTRNVSLKPTRGQQISYINISLEQSGSGTIRYTLDNVLLLTKPLTTTPTAPAAPTDLTAGRLVRGGIQLNWTAPQGAAQYRVYRSVDNGAFARFSTVTTTDTADNTIPTGTTGTFSYRVTALDASGAESQPSNVASITISAPPPTTTPPTTPPPTTPPTVPAPPAPSALSASISAGSSQAELNWGASVDAAWFKEYRIYRSASESFGFKQVGASATTSYVDDANAPSGTSVFYRVTTVYSDGSESAPSNVAEAIGGF